MVITFTKWGCVVFIRSESAIIYFPVDVHDLVCSVNCLLSHWLLNFQKTKKTRKNKREKFGSCFTVFSSSSNDPIHLGLQSYLFLINLIMPSLRVRHTWPGSTPPKNGNKGRRFGLFSVANLLLVFGRE